MFVNLPGVIGRTSSGGFPPAGTWLASVCSGPDAHDQGNADYTDANGSVFNGMFSLWEQLADGAGGSNWTKIGDNQTDGQTPTTSCWFPQYFYFSNGTDQVGFYWEACGSSGNFYYGQNYFYSYSNGDGTTSSGGGYGSYGYSEGYTIYDSVCCQVYYDGNSGYYYSDNCGGGVCPSYGTSLGSGCVSTSGTDAAGNYWSGAWVYADFFADGNCGQYTGNEVTNLNNCYYPSGFWTEYSSSQSTNDWYLYDSCSNYVASGTYVYANSSSGQQADGSGGTYSAGGSWNASYGDYFIGGSYSDCDGNYYNYEVRSDGMNGYYFNIYT